MKQMTYKYYKEHLLDSISDEDIRVLKFIKQHKKCTNDIEKKVLKGLEEYNE